MVGANEWPPPLNAQKKPVEPRSLRSVKWQEGPAAAKLAPLPARKRKSADPGDGNPEADSQQMGTLISCVFGGLFLDTLEGKILGVQVWTKVVPGPGLTDRVSLQRPSPSPADFEQA